MEVRITRIKHQDKQTVGNGVVIINGAAGFGFKTLELPWIGNKRYISCIPMGRYRCKKRHSQRFGNHFHILGVPGRSYILIHLGNYYRDTRGCVLVGKTLADIDDDGYVDVTHSKQIMERLNQILPNEFDVVINDQLSLTT